MTCCTLTDDSRQQQTSSRFLLRSHTEHAQEVLQADRMSNRPRHKTNVKPSWPRSHTPQHTRGELQLAHRTSNRPRHKTNMSSQVGRVAIPQHARDELQVYHSLPNVRSTSTKPPRQTKLVAQSYTPQHRTTSRNVTKGRQNQRER